MQLKRETTTICLRDVTCSLCYQTDRTQTLCDLTTSRNCAIHLPFNLSYQTLVLPYGAIVASNGTLVDVGSFVEVNDFEVQN